METLTKIQFALVTLVLLCIPGFAQDTLNYRNGEKAAVKVTEITASVIRYKKIENLEGPSYTDLKNDIASVRYKNGTLETFELQEPVVSVPPVMPFSLESKTYTKMESFGKTKFIYGNRIINNREMHSVMLNTGDREIRDHILTAQKQAKRQYIGFAFFPFAIAGIAAAADSGGLDDEAGAGIFLGAMGVACFVTSVTLKSKRTQHEKEALRLYQSKYQ